MMLPDANKTCLVLGVIGIVLSLQPFVSWLAGGTTAEP
jgi:hypothetical protein